MPHKPSQRLAATTLVLLLALSLTTIGAAAFSAGTVSFTTGVFEVNEGAGTAAVTLSRNGGAEGALTAKVSLTDVTTGAADYRLAPGSIDPSFALVFPLRFFYYRQPLALQPDGKVLVVGSPLLRLNADGTVDNSFHPPAFNAPTNTVAVQPDGKIIVSGSFTGIPGAIRIARLNPDGSLDTSFSTGAGLNDHAMGIALQPDGKIVIGGYFTSVNQSSQKYLARLNADGSVDNTFNSAATFNCYEIKLQPDGKILATMGVWLMRFNADGSVDNGFQVSFTAGYMLPLPDGKILAGGGFRINGVVNTEGVYRLNSDGTQDTSFHTGLGADSSVSGLVMQPDGKIVVSGYFASYDGNATGCLIRLNPDGTLDPSFNANNYSGSNPYMEAVIMQPDGKFIAVGSFLVNLTSGYRANVARFNGDVFVNWGDGDSADKTVSLPIVDDLLDEPDETATLTLTPLSAGSSTGAFPTATLSILDNDVAPAFTSGLPPQGIARAAYSHTFTATGSPTPTFSVTGGTLPSGLLLSSAGVLSGTPFNAGTYTGITVTASNGVSPAATQTFDLTVLSGGALQFSAGSYTVAENVSTGTATIQVDRVGGSAGATSVNFVISGNTASSGSDFSPASATLSFANGETSKSVTVTILNDDINERDEFANLFLNTVTGTGSLGTPTVAALNITNDDPLPSIAVEDITVTEGDTLGTKLATFTVTRTGLTDRAVGFTARTIDGTATSVEDYLPLNSFFQIGSSVTSTTVSVSILNDTLIEPDKSFSLLLTSPQNATISRAQATGVIKDNDTTTGAPTVQLAAREFRASEGAGVVTVTVTRSGDSSTPTNIGYTTSSNSGTGAASDRRDYTLAFGILSFAAGETTKSFNIFVADDAFVEGDETLSVTIGTPTGGVALGTPSSSVVRILDNDTAPSQSNPLDDTTFFVRQHYRDFLNRDPDASGLAFWVGEIEKCGTDTQCREVKRINVSAAFFLSIEFQETGYLVYLLHKAAFNTGEHLSLRTFLGDMQTLGQGVEVGAPGWEAKLEANRVAFFEGFMLRSQFISLYPQTMTAAQYVDALNVNTGDPLNPGAGGSLTQAERDQLVADLTSGARTRAQVLRAVVENREFKRRQVNKAFVLMEYFGYLRRGPNETPDSDFVGYNFWLGKLNEFNGNYLNAEMVKAYITAPEYRQRFGL